VPQTIGTTEGQIGIWRLHTGLVGQAGVRCARADPLERFSHAASVLHCLPVGRCAEQSAATGTVTRAGKLIETDLFRFYRLEGRWARKR